MKNKLLIAVIALLLPLWAGAQIKNTVSEVKEYQERDGKIVITCMVNGEEADFLLDLAGQTAVLPEYLEKLKIDPDSKGDFKYDKFQFKTVPTEKVVLINMLSFGNNVALNATPAFVLKDEPYLRELKVAGIVGGALFRNVVLTIDAQRKKLTMSQPYRPGYVRLDCRMDTKLLTGSGMECPVVIDGQTFPCVLDSWNNGLIEFNEADFARMAGKNGQAAQVSLGYAQPVTTQTKVAGKCTFVQNNLENQLVAENKSLVRSVIGLGMMKLGLVSIDYPRSKVYFQPFDQVRVEDEIVEDEIVVEAGKLNPINGVYFRNNIYDYTKGGEFVFKGEKPVVIDFWATWCGPCKQLMPVMEQWAEKYKDQVVFLKVNADKEKELCNKFNINALPTLFFIPVNGKPIVEVGATPEKFEKIIQELIQAK